ncbi:MAG: PAS domain S-box protein [Nitrospirales bacterium]
MRAGPDPPEYRSEIDSVPETTPISILLANEEAEESKLTTIRLRGFYPQSRVEAVYSTEELLNWTSRQEWDAIIVDEQLLIQGGLDHLTELRRHAPSAAIVVQAEKLDANIADQVVWAGADCYLYKQSPAFLTELPLVLRAVLESRGVHGRLELAEERLYRLTEQMTDVVYELDSEGRFLFVSPSVVSLLGYSPDELLGSHLSRILHSDDLLAERRMNELGAGTGGTRNLELRLVTKEGLIKPVKVMEVKLSGRGTQARSVRARGTLGMIRDLSSGNREPLQRLMEQLRQEQSLKQQYQQQLEVERQQAIQTRERVQQLEEQLRRDPSRFTEGAGLGEGSSMELSQLRERLRGLEDQLRHAEAQKRQYQEQVEEQRQRALHAPQAGRMQEAQELVQRLEERLRQATDDKQRYQQQAERQAQELAQAQDRCARLEEQARRAEEEARRFREQLDQQSQEASRLKERFQRMEEQVRPELVQKQLFQQQLEQHRQEVLGSQERLQQLEEQLQEAESQKRTIQHQLELERQQAGQVQERLQALEVQVREQEAQKRQVKQQMERQRLDDIEKQTYLNLLEEQRRELDQANERIQRLEEELRAERSRSQESNLKDLVKRLAEELKDERTQAQYRLSNLEERLQGVQAERQSYLEQLHQWQAYFQQLQEGNYVGQAGGSQDAAPEAEGQSAPPDQSPDYRPEPGPAASQPAWSEETARPEQTRTPEGEPPPPGPRSQASPGQAQPARPGTSRPTFRFLGGTSGEPAGAGSAQDGSPAQGGMPSHGSADSSGSEQEDPFRPGQKTWNQ